MKVLRAAVRSPLSGLGVRRLLLRLAGAQLGENVRIFEGVRFFCGHLDLGDRVMLTQDVFLQDFGRIRIGPRSGVGPRSVILTRTHDVGGSFRRFARQYDQETNIGAGCWLGASVTVLPGVTIGEGCVIAAGAVVTRDCEPNGLYGGVPAVRKRDLASEQEQAVARQTA